MLMLLLTAVFSLILGMGLPTTANYIVVSSLLAPVIVTLGQQTGPHRAADRRAPLRLLLRHHGRRDAAGGPGLLRRGGGLGGRSDQDRLRRLLLFSLRTAALPFLFIFNTDLLLIDVGWIGGIFVFIVATAAMLIFAAATQGFFFARNRDLRNRPAAAHRLHPLPPGLLDGHDLPALLRACRRAELVEVAE